MLLKAKARMRRRLRAARLVLAADRTQAGVLAAALAPLVLWPSRPVVAGYLAAAGEIDPAPLLERLAAAGATVVLPAVMARGAPLVFRQAHPDLGLQADAAGLPAPPPAAAERIPDLIIAPLLAFDRAGGRLGQGGGYYDRTIGLFRGRGAVIVVGLAFAGQEVQDTPMGPGDERLDAILTEQAYIEVAKE